MDDTGVMQLTYTLERVGAPSQYLDATGTPYKYGNSVVQNRVMSSFNNWNISFPTDTFTNGSQYKLTISATDASNNTGTATVNMTFKAASAATISTYTTTTLTKVKAPVIPLPMSTTLLVGTILPAGTIIPGSASASTGVTTTTVQLLFPSGSTILADTILPIGSILPTSVITELYVAPSTSVTPTKTTTTLTKVIAPVVTLPIATTLPAGTILPGTTTPTASASTLPAGTSIAVNTILPINTVLPTIVNTEVYVVPSTSTAVTLPSSTGSTLTGSTLTGTTLSTGSTMTGATLKPAVVKDNGNNTISFPITFSTVTFAKDAVNASMNATVTTTERLPAGTPLKLCYQKVGSLVTALCTPATLNTDGTFTIKTTIRSDEAATYNWILGIADSPTSTYGTLDIKVTNGVSTYDVKILKNEPMASVTINKDMMVAAVAPLKPAAPNEIAIEISVDKVTWSQKDKVMAVEVTFVNSLSNNLPVAICYTEKVTAAKQECITLAKTVDKVYSGATNISATTAKSYVWLVAVNNSPLNTDGTLTITEKNGVFEALAQTITNTKTTINVDKNLLITATGSTLAETGTGTTLTCPPRCIVSSSLVNDVPVDNFAFSPISKLIARGIMSGYADGTFKPANPINRAEFSKLTKNTFLIPTLDRSAALSFSDITANAWFYSFVRSLSQVGLIKGYSDGTFRAGNNILRSEAAKMIALAHRMQVVRNANPKMMLSSVLEKADQDITASFIAFTSENPTYTYVLLSDVPTNSWYAKYVYYAVRNDLIKGRDSGNSKVFAPGAQILRGEAATLLSRVIDNLDIRYPVTVNTSGAVTVNFPE